MTKKGYSKCQTCSGQLARKKAPKRPYGANGTNPWCHSCDMDYNYKVSKSGARKKAQQQIKKELGE